MKRFFVRSTALVLAAALTSSTVLAAIKGYAVRGVRSINDRGSSDYRITAEELEKDYEGYLQTDGMTEYFHKDQSEPVKTNVSEAVAWLIDNGIYIRDSRISISNLDTSAGSPPVVSISKVNIADYYDDNVSKSDALMYIYKATYGPLKARTLGVETKSIRVDSGREMTLDEIVKARDFDLWQSIFAGNSTANSMATAIAQYKNDAIAWRYTPQAERYTSVWGDTNIFIAQNTFEQDVDASISVAPYGVNYGDTDGKNTVDYETDYKSVYLVPGGDIWFYDTNDAIEPYLQAIESRGLDVFDSAEVKPEYESVFGPYKVSTLDQPLIPYWSGNADPYVVNLREGKHIRVENVSDFNTSAVPSMNGLTALMGQNFRVNYNSSGQALEVVRQNLFDSGNAEHSYFQNEAITRMDVYRYIYKMVSASEKKLSDLERDLVNYKYGMEFTDLMSPDDEEALKYLVAKGILDFSGRDDFNGLYGAINYRDFSTILYRVANKDARLNFTQIQLTDSEQAWDAMGFMPQTVGIAEPGPTSSARIEYTDAYKARLSASNSIDATMQVKPAIETVPEDMTFFEHASNGVRAVLGIERQYNLNANATTASSAGETVGTVQMETTAGELRYDNNTFFDLNGIVCKLGRSQADQGVGTRVLSNFKEDLNLVDDVVINKTITAKVVNPMTSKFDSHNLYHQMFSHYLANVWMYHNIKTYSSDFIKTVEEWASVHGDTATGMKEQMLRQINTVVKGSDQLPTITKVMLLGGITKTGAEAIPQSEEDCADFLRNLSSITFTSSKFDGKSDDQLPQIKFKPSASDESATQTSYAFWKKEVNEVKNKAVAVYMEGISPSDLRRGTATPTMNVNISCSSVRNQAALTEGQALRLYLSPTRTEAAFVSLNEIQKVNPNIIKVSDLILYNRDTDVYAYFGDAKSTEDSRAIVGSMIFEGTPDQGTCFKQSDASGGAYMYYFPAVAQLLNLADQKSLSGGARAISKSSDAFTDNIKPAPIVGQSGTTMGQAHVINIALSTDFNTDSKNARANSAYFTGSRYASGGKVSLWHPFISAASANKLANVISKKIEFKDEVTGNQHVMYAVVMFNPVDMSDMGTVKLDPNASLQDLLDSPGQPPTDEADLEVWTKNKELCNHVCNWIYGTSDKDYINTGWYTPDVKLYLLSSDNTIKVPNSVYSPLTTDEINTVIKGLMTSVYDTYYASQFGKAEQVPSDKSCIGYMAYDYSACVLGGNLYITSDLFHNFGVGVVSKDASGNPTLGLVAKNKYARAMSFVAGQSFKLGTKTSFENPMCTVISVTNGEVTAQVGPITGMPVKKNGKFAILSRDEAIQNSKKLIDLNLFGESNTVQSHDLWKRCFEGQIASSIRQYITQEGICANPSLSNSSNSGNGQFLCVGSGPASDVIQHPKFDVSAGGAAVTVNSFNLPEYSSIITPNDYYTKVVESAGTSTTVRAGLAQSGNLRQIDTYFTIKFSALQFTVQNGSLVYMPADAADYLDPLLFTSVNDLIINSMLLEAKGGIPLNEVPEGAYVKLSSDSYFIKLGATPEEAIFRGWPTLAQAVAIPTLQDAMTSFASQMISAGSQPINISHWVKSADILVKDTKGKPALVTSGKDGKLPTGLQDVLDNTLTGTQKAKIFVYADGAKDAISADGTVLTNIQSNSGTIYCPLELTFQDGLYAVPEDGNSTSSIQRYTVHPIASNSATGALDDVPFISDSALTQEMKEINMEMGASAFQQNPRADTLAEYLQKEFKAGFSGDVFTLVRMLVFCLLIWLIIAGWLCWVAKYANMMPILESIRYPSGDTGRKGIDLMKIVSLGTITMDDEFTIGRLFQYELVLCALVCLTLMMGDTSFVSRIFG